MLAATTRTCGEQSRNTPELVAISRSAPSTASLGTHGYRRLENLGQKEPMPDPLRAFKQVHQCFGIVAGDYGASEFGTDLISH